MKLSHVGVNDKFSIWNADAAGDAIEHRGRNKKDSEFLDRVMYISLGIILGYFILRD